MIKRYELLI